jgi:hypothetical protein
MNRRSFLSSASTALAASSLALTRTATAESPAAFQASGKPAPEFYELRRYQLASGPQTKLTANYFAQALIPALNRLGITPVGAFSLDFGPGTPAYYLLLPSPSLETLVTSQLQLAKDDAFLKAAAPFWSAPAAAPPFDRVESSLLRAFEGWPRITPPAGGPTTKRIFQLRTYQSPTPGDHVRKVEMFHSGEFDIFAKAGCGQVFYGDTLVGPRLPNLTYMLTFPDTAALEKGWDNFRDDPAWKKLSSNPRYAFESIVSNVDNQILKPLPCSQV